MSHLEPSEMKISSGEMSSPRWGVLRARNRFAQKIVALFGAVAAKSFAVAEFIGCSFHGVNGGLRQRFGDIADAAADHVFGGIGLSSVNFFTRREISGNKYPAFSLR